MRSGPLTDRAMGNWVLREMLDEGGVGAVYVAEHRFLAEKAAVKVLHPQPVQTRAEDTAMRFFQEGRATRSIDHPNVVKILDLGQADDGTLYLVMELLQGSSIHSVLARTPIDERSSAFIAAAVAGGLQAAHEKGIIHRDLKPANIFLCASGQVRLLDFGMAKVKQGGLRTAVGMLVGTPQYMAPEQIRQEPDVGPRADIYGLGAVLFKMITGRLPFESDSLLDIVKMHLATPAPRPSQLLPVSAEMDAIVVQCMEKDPARRPASMSELRERLRPIAEQLGPGAAARLEARQQSDELLPKADTARGLHELARADAWNGGGGSRGRRPRAARSGGWAAPMAAMLGVTVLAGLVLALHPWSRASSSGTTPPVAAPPNLAPPPVAAPPNATPPPVAAPPNTGTAAGTGTGTAPPPATPDVAPANGALLRVESEPPGAQVFADHVPRGVTPIDLMVPLPVELKFTLDGYKTVRRKVTKPDPVHMKLFPVAGEGEQPVTLPSPPTGDPGATPEHP
jgi:serine/threonine-protein kinase